jgi:hypothetical protein
MFRLKRREDAFPFALPPAMYMLFPDTAPAALSIVHGSGGSCFIAMFSP